MIEISKELLEEILKVKVLKHKLNTKSLRYNYFENGVEYTSFSINIYELAHKCKEWANYYGLFLYPARAFECIFVQYGCAIMKPDYHEGKFAGLFGIDKYDERDYLASTEVEAIIKACEWILKEINK